MANKTPTYNIKAVLKETGLKPDVLRAWERRYSLPMPQRTPGGHRLYSEYDIQTINWLRARQAEGLSISRAVDLWKETLKQGLDPLDQYPQANIPTPDYHLSTTSIRIQTLRQQWLDAILAFNSYQADAILNQAFAIYPVETVCTEIIQQGIREIGNFWLIGKASVQQEHFASKQAHRRLETLITATPPPTRKETVLVGCPPGEQHTFSILLLNLFLRRRGIKVINLGADIPISQMSDTAMAIKPNLIVLAAQTLSSAASLQSALFSLQGLEIPLAYGGLIFNRISDLRQQLPAIFLGESLEEAVQTIENLLVTPSPIPVMNISNTTTPELSLLLREKRPQIEVAFLEKLPKAIRKIAQENDVNSHFGDSLSAALQLGNPAYTEADLDWVRILLTQRYSYADLLALYLNTYRNVISLILGSAGAPINDWINMYLSQMGESNHPQV